MQQWTEQRRPATSNRVALLAKQTQPLNRDHTGPVGEMSSWIQWLFRILCVPHRSPIPMDPSLKLAHFWVDGWSLIRNFQPARHWQNTVESTHRLSHSVITYAPHWTHAAMRRLAQGKAAASITGDSPSSVRAQIASSDCLRRLWRCPIIGDVPIHRGYPQGQWSFGGGRLDLWKAPFQPSTPTGPGIASNQCQDTRFNIFLPMPTNCILHSAQEKRDCVGRTA